MKFRPSSWNRLPYGRHWLACAAVGLGTGLTLGSTLPLPAFAQPRPEPEFGVEAKERPGFQSKSEILEEPSGGGAGATVNRGAEKTDRVADLIYFRYKGVDLPLKKYVEYQGSQPYVRIIDGEDVLWIARRGDVDRMLDLVLYNQLDTMTGAADALLQRQRFSAAFRAYGDVLDILRSEKNELRSPDLRHYPAIRSYLQFRMGQARGWEAHARWRDAEAAHHRAHAARARAARMRNDPDRKPMSEVWDTIGSEHQADADAAVVDAKRLDAESRALLESAVATNERLWQAHNELGLAAAARAERRSADGAVKESEKELEEALSRFQKARRGDAKEIVDGNLIAIYSSMADIAHARGRFGKALELLRQAMELTGETDESSVDTPSYQVTFTDFDVNQGERIVVTAELRSGIARKYLSIERDRRAAGGRETVVEEESAILARWRSQGEALLKRKRWRDAIGFYTALHDEYGLSEETSGVSPEFRAHVTASLETSIGSHAVSLLQRDREEEAIGIYALALEYLPGSTVLNQAHLMQASRDADRALASGQWERALAHLWVMQRIYEGYTGAEADKLETRKSVSLKLGAAYVGLTRSALDRGDVDRALGWADSAMGLVPLRGEWKENKGRALVASARLAEAAGDMDGALRLYEQAERVAIGPIKARAMFKQHAVQLRLLIPKAKRRVVAVTQDYGALIVLCALGIMVGIPASQRAMSGASRRRRARSLRSTAQKAYDAKNWNEAVDLYNDYLLMNVGIADPEVYERVARAYRKIGDYDSALRFFERASKRMPGRRFNLERAEIYLMKRNLSLALQALRTSPNLADDAARLVHFLNYLREKDGESVFVTEALAQVQITAGDLEAGRQLYLRLLDLEARSPRTLKALAEIARRAGNSTERRQYLEQLVQIDGSDAGTLRELGNLHAGEGSMQPAIEYLRRAFEIAPAEGLAARIAELQAEYLVREAEAEIARLLREEPTPNRRFRLGELHWRLGRTADAKPFFEETSAVREFQARALRYLGLIALAQGNPEEAISLLRGYLAKRTNLAPDAAEKEARYALAEAFEKAGSSDLAAAQFDAIFEADPGYKDVSHRVKQRMAKVGMARGPQDCPFCRRRVPGDAEYCPHCNFHLSTGSASKYELTPTVNSPTPPPGPPDPDDGPKGGGG